MGESIGSQRYQKTLPCLLDVNVRNLRVLPAQGRLIGLGAEDLYEVGVSVREVVESTQRPVVKHNGTGNRIAHQ